MQDFGGGSNQGPAGGVPMGPLQPATSGTDEDLLGWLGLLAGVLSWLSCCCFVVPIVNSVAAIAGLLVSMVGAVLSGISIAQQRKAGRPIGLGVAGLVLNLARFLVTIGLMIFALVAFGSLLAFGAMNSQP